MKFKVLKWLCVLIVVISLGWFVYLSDLEAIKMNLLEVGWGFIWIILVTFTAQLFGTLSWKSTLPKDSKVSFINLLLIRYIGDQVGLVNPTNFVGGDAFKAYQLEKNGVDYSESISSLLIARMIIIYIQVVVFLIAAVGYLFVISGSKLLLVQLIILSVVFLVVVALATLHSGRLVNLRWLTKRQFHIKAQEIKSTITSYYKKEKGRFLMANFWGAINFVIGALEIWLICDFIGVDLTYLESLLVDQGVLFLKSFGAFVPGQVGVEEYINKLMLGIVGVTSMSVWISVSIFRRARQLFWIILGIPVYYLFMKSIHKTDLALQKD